jgi:hypothetical protein
LIMVTNYLLNFIILFCSSGSTGVFKLFRAKIRI